MPHGSQAATLWIFYVITHQYWARKAGMKILYYIKVSVLQPCCQGFSKMRDWHNLWWATVSLKWTFTWYRLHTSLWMFQVENTHNGKRWVICSSRQHGDVYFCIFKSQILLNCLTQVVRNHFLLLHLFKCASIQRWCTHLHVCSSKGVGFLYVIHLT